MKIEPIKLPQDWPKYDYKLDAVYQSFGFWEKVNFNLSTRWKKLDIWVKKKLKDRENADFITLWKEYPELINDAQKLQNILKEQLWSFAPNFIPEDSYILLGQLLTGDLCEIDAIMDIEECFKISLPDEHTFWDKTISELLKYINDNKNS